MLAPPPRWLVADVSSTPKMAGVRFTPKMADVRSTPKMAGG